MRIKRWAIYDGVAGQYYYKRFFTRRGAERAQENIIFFYALDTYANDDFLTDAEIDSIQVVELA